MRDSDLQFLAKVMRMVQLREQHLRQAATIDEEILTLHSTCRPEIRRTIDRLALLETDHLDCSAPDQPGRALYKN